MTMAIRKKEEKILKIKESLSKLKLFLNDITNNSEKRMMIVLKNNEKKKTLEILEELKKM